jgi:hypothetical protein
LRKRKRVDIGKEWLARLGERISTNVPQRIIFWKDGDDGLALAARELKLAIRVKLPYETRMQDPKAG